MLFYSGYIHKFISIFTSWMHCDINVVRKDNQTTASLSKQMIRPLIDDLKLHLDFVKIHPINQLHANLVHSNLHSDVTTITKFDLPTTTQLAQWIRIL